MPNKEGMTPEPNLDDPAIVYVHRAMEALRAEFEDDEQVPRFVVVVETPPDGRIGIATTADDEIDSHRMLTLGAASVRASMTEEERDLARAMWETLKAGFERRN